MTTLHYVYYIAHSWYVHVYKVLMLVYLVRKVRKCSAVKGRRPSHNTSQALQTSFLHLLLSPSAETSTGPHLRRWCGRVCGIHESEAQV